MGVLFRHKVSIVPELPTEPHRARAGAAFGVHTFHTPEGRAAAQKIAAGPGSDSWAQVFPYLPAGLFDSGPYPRPRAPVDGARTLCLSLITFAVVGGASVWLIGG